MSLAAERVLEEFGGLRVDCQGPGLECARFSSTWTRSWSAAKRTGLKTHFRDQVGGDLFPLGEAFNGQAFLAIFDGLGWVHLLGDRAQLLGDNIYCALDFILMVLCSLEILLGQTPVNLIFALGTRSDQPARCTRRDPGHVHRANPAHGGVAVCVDG